jgi:hypothetical protein
MIGDAETARLSDEMVLSNGFAVPASTRELFRQAARRKEARLLDGGADESVRCECGRIAEDLFSRALRPRSSLPQSPGWWSSAANPVARERTFIQHLFRQK